MSATGKTRGLLTGLPNPAAKKPAAEPVRVSPEAEAAFGLSDRPAPFHAEPAPPEPPPTPPVRPQPDAAAPERSKTFFLPLSVCDRLEMQKLSERREMKHIVRQALEEYFERNPLRAAVKSLMDSDHP